MFLRDNRLDKRLSRNTDHRNEAKNASAASYTRRAWHLGRLPLLDPKSRVTIPGSERRKNGTRIQQLLFDSPGGRMTEKENLCKVLSETMCK